MRAILLAIFANGQSTIDNVLLAPDTHRLIDIGRQLGASMHLQGNRVVITGVGGKCQSVSAPLDIGNSGILRRFLTAILATQPHRYKLVGDTSVMSRPMDALQKALLMRNVQFFDDGSFQGPFLAGHTSLKGQDSQPVSALLFAAALTPGETTIEVSFPGELPWIDMTLHWLKFLDVTFEHIRYRTYKVIGRSIDAFNYTIPSDFSTAAFPYVGGIITQGDVSLNIERDDTQGDQKFLEMNILDGGEFDLNQCIDAVPIAAVKACFARDLVVLTDIGIARTKECDRLHVIAKELRKMGGEIYELDDGLVIKPSKLVGAEVESYGDHRIAMALAVAGCAAAGKTVVSDVGCIAKTYPEFVESFVGLGACITQC